MTGQSGPTIRLKLTLLYGGLFLVSGLLLIAITYGLVRRQLAPPPSNNGIGSVIENRIEERLDERATQEAEQDPDDREDRARREERTNALRQLWRQSLIALLITGSGALVLGWIVAGRVLNPIRQITDHAQRASVATLGDRIDLQGPSDELKDLADTFDSMLDRLQAAFEAQRGFAAQASHELRTPLSIIRAEAEVARNRSDLTPADLATIDSILVAATRSDELIDGLLALARSESTMLDMAAFDLAQLTGDVVGEYFKDADSAGVRIDLNLDTAMIRGDKSLLTRLIGNLTQNGIRYNRRDGSLDISVSSDDEFARLTVTNSGPNVAQAEIDTLFKPFARGSWAQRNRSGHGLGLAIVQSVVSAHGGTVVADPGPDGGLRITVSLPVAQN